jgi:hypothetical protein
MTMNGQKTSGIEFTLRLSGGHRAIALVIIALFVMASDARAAEKSVDLDLGWKFAKDEAMALDGRTVSARDFDDQGWQTVIAT